MNKALLLGIAVILSGCAARSSSYVTDKTVTLQPSVEPVCLLKGPLPSSIKHRVIGEIAGSKKSYGSVEEILPLMANEARKMGADAIVNMQASQRMGFFAWARPMGNGTAVKVDNRADLNCAALGGENR